VSIPSAISLESQELSENISQLLKWQIVNSIDNKIMLVIGPNENQ